MPDSYDYTPQQALFDASNRAANEDFDGAIILLVRGVDSGTTDLCHYISGLNGIQASGVLGLLKTRIQISMLE